MKLVGMMFKLLILFIALFLSVNVYAFFDFSSDRITREGFERSGSFDLLIESELGGDYGNYADIQLSGVSSSDIYLDQDLAGEGVNRAGIIIKNGSIDSRVVLTQSGSDNTALVEQEGIGNTAILVQEGHGHEGHIIQAGDNNLAYLKQQYRNGYSSSISIEQLNDNNVAVVVDRGGSNYSIKQDGGSQIAVWSSMSRHISIEQ